MANMQRTLRLSRVHIMSGKVSRQLRREKGAFQVAVSARALWIMILNMDHK